jgi:Tol biopolymer transport system component/DNA-binding winged helix-turn-helix (wHTH) protein
MERPAPNPNAMNSSRPNTPNPHTVQFGLFEVNLHSRELRKSGVKVKLNDQPFQVLTVLLERPGEVVTREELQTRLWPANTFVDFDLSLNGAVKKLRQALGDESDNPRFVETLYRRGYRFIAPVSTASRELPLIGENGARAGTLSSSSALPVSTPMPNSGNGSASMSADSRSSNKSSNESASKSSGDASNPLRKWLALAVGVALALIAGLFWELTPRSSPRILGFTQITNGGKVHQLGAVATDGQRLYFQAVDRGRIALAQVSVSGGESALIPTPFDIAYLADVAPDGSSMLIISVEGTKKEASTWILPLPVGSPRPLGTMKTHSAVWAPDGRRLLFAQGADLYEGNLDGTDTRKLATLAARIGDVSVAPDGGKIRVTVEDMKTGSSEFWELNRDGKQPHPLLPNWSDSPRECCGRWTPDGKYFLFTSLREGRNSIWVLPERRSWLQPKAKPVQLTNGPLDFSMPVPSKDGKRIFAMGGMPRSEVLRYDGRSFVPFFSDVSATDLAFSADGQRVAYVSVPEQTLWASKSDGSDRIQLSDPATMDAALPRWSPDGNHIAFMAKTRNTDWRAYLVATNGQDLRELIPGATAGFDPGWSPDGKSIVLSLNDSGTVSNRISILDLETRKLSPVPGGENLFSPRWSPDGRYIAAITTDSQTLMLFDRTSQHASQHPSQAWTELARMGIGYPSWSHDGQYLYFDSIFTDDPAWFRVRISDHQLERLASLKDIHRLWGQLGEWSGVGPGDSLLVTRDIGSPEIYALDWEP